MPVAMRRADIARTIELLRLVEQNGEFFAQLDAKRLADMFAEQLEPSTIIITDKNTCS
jgi:hypothetical protein